MRVDDVELSSKTAERLAHTSHEAEAEEWSAAGRLDPAMDEDTAILFVIDGIAGHRGVITWTTWPRLTSSIPWASAWRSAPLANGWKKLTIYATRSGLSNLWDMILPHRGGGSGLGLVDVLQVLEVRIAAQNLARLPGL